MTRNRKSVVLVLSLIAVVAALAYGCSSSGGSGGQVKGDTNAASDAMVDGAWADVQLKLLADGSFYATIIDVAESDAAGADGEDPSDDVEDFSGRVDSVAADGQSFVIFGGLTVMEEADDGSGDAEQPGDLGIADLQPGMWVEVAGNYGYDDPGQTDGETNDGLDGVFYASQIVANDDGEEFSMNSIIEDMTSSGFTMLGISIAYDAQTSLNPETNDD